MSRIMKVMIVLLAITAMVAPTVFAEDRLSLSGQMRVRGFFTNVDDGTMDDSAAWNDQRLRIQGKIAVAEGVSVIFRTDIGEAKISDGFGYDAQHWGENGQNSVRFSNLHFDKAYLQLEKNGYTLMAGQQYWKTGITGSLADHVGTGFTVKRDFLTLFHTKTMDSNTSTSDASLTGFQATFGNDGFKGMFFGTYDQGEASDDDTYGLGFAGSANLGAVGIKGEIVYMNGENAAGADEKGLQIYLDASTAISETVTLGGVILWADAQDNGDVQISRIAGTGFGEFRVLDYGFMTTQMPHEVDNFMIDTNAGMQALELYADVKANDDMSMKFSGAYAQTDDDDVSDIDGFILNASLNYAVMANTSLAVHGKFQSYDDNGTDVDALAIGSGLSVKF